MKTAILALFLLCALQVFGQDLLVKVIADDQTGSPVSYAHIYLTDKGKSGTLSNAEGHFILQLQSPGDTLVISHIGYLPFKASVATLTSDTIFLKEKTLTLDEVPIYALDDVSIFKKVMERLDLNHTDENMIYDVMLRSMTYREDQTALHTLIDYSLEANYKSSKSSNLASVRVHPQRVRMGRFSNEMANRSIFPHIDLLSLWDFQIFTWELWKKNTPKKYDIRLTGTSQEESRNLLHLQLSAREGADVVTLFIDEETFAVTRRLATNVETGRFSDIRYKEVNGTWYLSYCIERYVTSSSHIDPGHTVVSEKIALYDLAPEKSLTDKFVGYINVTSNIWEDKIDTWEDPYWDQFHHLPFPAWMMEILSTQPERESKRLIIKR